MDYPSCLPKYYRSSHTMRHITFFPLSRSGCKGNANNFKSPRECQTRCAALMDEQVDLTSPKQGREEKKRKAAMHYALKENKENKFYGGGQNRIKLSPKRPQTGPTAAFDHAYLVCVCDPSHLNISHPTNLLSSMEQKKCGSGLIQLTIPLSPFSYTTFLYTTLDLPNGSKRGKADATDRLFLLAQSLL